MSADVMTAIKQQAAALTVQEKVQLATYLLEQTRLEQLPQGNRITTDQDIRQRRLAWLKTHRERYGGQYVALDGTQLLAVGPSYRAARASARAAGKPQAFVTYVSKSDEVAEWGGWSES